MFPKPFLIFFNKVHYFEGKTSNWKIFIRTKPKCTRKFTMIASGATNNPNTS
jgi:hypothetical protein